ncbi:hypothetical protein CBR_g15989 [Chara braunii]|uniref:KIF-binding protein n=1 Tax=Chara braunii TaxID=69332 RepID=A0A388JST8_CHABU|nr:hypothetical protein CBR_g15989 [Chara braunii]|eukprot:GBG60868.1 hypothetical protein CBR_g15989 [Chara braunii]
MAEASSWGEAGGDMAHGDGDGDGDGDALSWMDFSSKEFVKEYREIERLAAAVDPETEPFRSKYKAMERLEALQRRAAWYAAPAQTVDEGKETSQSAREVEEAKDMVALLDQRIGALAVDTEQLGLAQRSLLLAIERLKTNEDRHAEVLQHSYNLLGVIWSNRNEHQKAEAYLLEAERIYKHHSPGRSVSSHVADRGVLLPFYVDDLDSCLPTACGDGQTEASAAAPVIQNGVVNQDETGEAAAPASECSRMPSSTMESSREGHEDVVVANKTPEGPEPSKGSNLRGPSDPQNEVLGSGDRDSSIGRMVGTTEMGRPCSIHGTSEHLLPDERGSSVEEEKASDGGSNRGSEEGKGGERTPRQGVADQTVKAGKQLSQRMEILYTLTAFYLAQVYERLNETRKSAAYCMTTLNRQLEYGDTFECLEWVRNCTQLAEFYTQEGELSNALYCLSAAQAVLAKNSGEFSKSGFSAVDAEANIMLSRGRVHMRCLGMSRDRAVDREGEEEAQDAGVDESEKRDQEGEEAAQDAGADESEKRRISGAGSVPNGSGCGRAGDVCVVQQEKPEERKEEEEGAVRTESHARQKVGEAEEDGNQRSCAAVTPNFRKLNLPVPSPEDEFGSKDGLVVDYQGAVRQFNEGMKYFKRALERYVLDGFVTDHFFILMDISTIHKYLAYFEKNVKRCSQIHKRRATRLEVLAEQLNPDAYPLIWKQLNTELGAIYREVAERLSEVDASAAKVAAAALQSVTFYERVFSVSDVGKIQEDHHRNLTIAFSLARMYQKLHGCSKEEAVSSLLQRDGGDSLAYLKKSLDMYNFVVEYGSKHYVQGMQEHIALCKEMAELLPASIAAQASGYRQVQR